MYNYKKTFTRNRLYHYIRVASGISLMALGSVALAQNENTEENTNTESIEEIQVTGQRASVLSAQDIKRDSNEIVDSIVASDIGKLPDRSITEALQRVPGVTVTRYDSMSDPEHFAGEGAGVAVRGLSQVRAELNGRDVFSANGGRSLSFDDVPAELMAGVDTYKSPSANMIEGGLGGVVNLRTRMPFDSDGQVISATAKGNYGDQIEEANGEYSALFSDRWETGIGEFGFLINLSTSDLSSRADNIYTRAYFPRTDIEEGETVWVSPGADWRRNDYQRERDGQYIALQWAPSDDLELYATAFNSKHEQQWDEAAFFIDAGNYTAAVKGADDWVYDSSGALVSGTITTNNGNGMAFGTSSRYSKNISETTDFSLGANWQVTQQLSIKGDLQYIDSTSETEDYTLGLVTFPGEIYVEDLNGAPSITVADNFLADASNYSYGQMMSMPSDNQGDSVAVRIDLKYDLEDNFIRSVQTGVRYTDKSTSNAEAFSWSAMYQPWQTGWLYPNTDAFPSAQASDLIEFSYGSFQRGNVNVPGSAYLLDHVLLRDYRGTTDRLREFYYDHVDALSDPAGVDWHNPSVRWNELDLASPANLNTQDETTEAVYLQANFAFDELALPIDGNVGVRYVRTDNVAHGHLRYGNFVIPGTSDPLFPTEPVVIDAENGYDHVLPSLNLRLHATDDLMIRFAASQAVWRPEFWRLKSLIDLSVNWVDGIEPPQSAEEFDPSMIYFSLTSTGNPTLEPMTAKQYDLSAEWYFDDNGGMAHLNLFRKDVSDVFGTVTENTVVEGMDVVASWMGNVGTADIQGAELGFTKFFDFLPQPWNGFGVQANYTYIDSSVGVPPEVEPSNTDGSTYADLPFEGLSEHAYNLVGMYEQYGFYARLAWNWRSEYLVSANANGWKDDGAGWHLPIYNDDYGQLDLSIGYNITDNMSVNFEAANVTKEETVGLMDQGEIGKRHAYTYSQDVRYATSIRVTF
ncbi:TonB-dependent receptor [Microbulbifer sp. SH-1]|uniref:TonB-dependent receptor n=1 Tax=Microbulbifer sp. SH-1 TaxID=2681547 RepID=UPI00140C349F|nr:TonB-dependent receptor [Microbulbifer sp. SH-1]QIL90168.1 TonB-dependent receptor [Microbulbifer sp. SH-1]